MIRTILCEDEYWVRKGLIRQIPWDRYGLELAGEFSNSSQAVEFMKNNSVDLVITDMNMKDGDGLSLLDHIITTHAECEIIVISGYTDFAYTKKAIQASVCEYLLKPVETEEICKVLDKIMLRIHEKEKLLEREERTVPLLQEQLLNTLVSAGNPAEKNQKIVNELSRMGFSLSDTWFTVQIFTLRKEFTETDGMLTDSELQRWFRNTEPLVGSDNCIFFRTKRSREHFILLWQGTDQAPVSKADFILTYRKLAESCPYLLKSGISDNVKGYSGIPLCYRHASACLDYELTEFGVSRPVFYEDISRLSTAAAPPVIIDEAVLSGIIKSGSVYEFKKYMSDLFRPCCTDSYCYLPSYRNTASKLALSMERFAAGKELSFAELSGAIRYISDMISAEEIRTFLSVCFQKIAESCKYEKNTSAKDVVTEIKEYVRLNYSEEISLMELARKYYINHIYLSRLFKAETGENFSSYLTRIRMEKARELIMKDTFKVKEVAEMVGFKNPYYFTKTFKKYYESAPALLKKIK